MVEKYRIHHGEQRFIANGMFFSGVQQVDISQTFDTKQAIVNGIGALGQYSVAPPITRFDCRKVLMDFDPLYESLISNNQITGYYVFDDKYLNWSNKSYLTSYRLSMSPNSLIYNDFTFDVYGGVETGYVSGISGLQDFIDGNSTPPEQVDLAIGGTVYIYNKTALLNNVTDFTYSWARELKPLYSIGKRGDPMIFVNPFVEHTVSMNVLLPEENLYYISQQFCDEQYKEDFHVFIHTKCTQELQRTLNLTGMRLSKQEINGRISQNMSLSLEFKSYTNMTNFQQAEDESAAYYVITGYSGDIHSQDISDNLNQIACYQIQNFLISGDAP